MNEREREKKIESKILVNRDSKECRTAQNSDKLRFRIRKFPEGSNISNFPTVDKDLRRY